jgi:hypothetical protein
MTISNALYSSRTDEWPTPRHELNAEFGFTLDPCASAENAKCRTFYTKVQDGLKQDWKTHRVFCNQPYAQIVEITDTHSGKKKREQIFPRYHQLDVVRRLLAHLKENGALNHLARIVLSWRAGFAGRAVVNRG